MQWLKQLFTRRYRYEELSETIREHLEEKIADLMDGGMTREDATRVARREFGNVTLIEERSREVWQWPTLESIWADVKFALRQLRKSPGFTVSALLTLGLGIGANTAVFSVVNAVMFRPLPYSHPEKLVSILSRVTEGAPSLDQVSYPNFFDWRSHNTAFDRMAAYHDDEFTLSGSGEAIHLDGEVVSWDLFPLLGVKPILGRSFLQTEESVGTRVAVLSYGLWQKRFQADPKLIGRTVTIDKLPYTVVGIAPQSFQFPVQNPTIALWTTIAHDALASNGEAALTTQRGTRTLDVIARLKPGVTLETARAQMDGRAGMLAKQYPEDNHRLAGVYATTELDRVIGNTRRPLFLLLGAVGLVLVIACANIATLLLLRTSARQRELAMRIALGAGRHRVIRQLMTENLFLAALGSATGLLFCFPCNRLLTQIAGNSIPRLAQTAVDTNVLAFSILLAILTSALFSLPTAIQVAKMDSPGSLKVGISKNARSQDTVRNSLVVGQITLGLMLLTGAALLISSLLHLEKQNTGFRSDHLLTFSLGVSQEQLGGIKQVLFYQQLLDRLDDSAGISSAAAVGPLPLTGDQISFAFDIQERPSSQSNRPRSDMAFVTPGYFETAGTPIFQGRDFTKLDNMKSPPVLIVNKAFGDKFFPGENPIGKQVKVGSSVCEVVGVVGNARQSALSLVEEPIGYLPFYQLPVVPVSVVVHTSVSPRTLDSTIRSAVASLDQQIPVYEIRTVQDLLSAQIADPRLHGILMSIFAGLALILTIVGLYGAVAYSVARRTRDIGIRMALGASRNAVVLMVLKQAMGLVLLGIALGAIGTLFGTALLGNMLYGITATNPRPFLLACCLMVVTGVFAAYIPARRAAAIDPVRALRTE
jgi:predicted permease